MVDFLVKVEGSRRFLHSREQLGLPPGTTSPHDHMTKSEICGSLPYPNSYPARHMGVSKNDGTPKSCILIWFSIINHPFWGTPIFGNIHILPLIPLLQPETLVVWEVWAVWKWAVPWTVPFPGIWVLKYEILGNILCNIIKHSDILMLQP